MNVRMLAVKRSASVALRFEAVGRTFAIADFLDGNGNGVRAAEIAAGIDAQLAPRQFLHEQFPAVVFGLRANLPERNQDRTACAPGPPIRGALDRHDAARIPRPCAVLECS